MWRHSDPILRLLFVSCVALVAVPFIAANGDGGTLPSREEAADPAAQVKTAGDQRFFDFDFGFISKDCGPKTGCDCASTNTDCSSEEIMKYCEVCNGDLDIDSRFKGFTAFWMLKEVTGDVILYDNAADVKGIELPQLKTIGGGMYLGGSAGSVCPSKFEYLNAPKLATVGTTGKGTIEVGGYPMAAMMYTEGCPKLYKFNTPSLTYVGQSISFVNNDVLQTLAFPHLKGVGNFPIDNNGAPGTITIMGNDDLKLYSAPKALQQKAAGDPSPKYTITANPKLKLAVIMNNDVGDFNVVPTQNKDKAMALYMLPESKDTKYGSSYDYGLYDEIKFDAFDFMKGDKIHY